MSAGRRTRRDARATGLGTRARGRGRAVRAALLWGVLCLPAFSGCVLRTEPFQLPFSSEVPDLRARWTADPSSVRTAIRLAAAHVAAGDVPQAAAVLASTHDIVPSDPALTLILGMAEHRMGTYLDADRRYAAFLGADPTNPLVPDVLIRRYAVRPHVLRAEAARWVAAGSAAARADERARGARAGGGVAVLPFAHDPADNDAAAHVTALSELLAADLARVAERVLDPAEIRALLRAMEVEPDRRDALGTAARVGGLTGADAVLYGTLLPDTAGGRRMVRATLWRAGSEGYELVDLSPDPLPGGLVALEKRLAMTALARLVGEVTPEDARGLAQRQIASDEALVAFGSGVLATDEGRHSEAAEALGRARRLDPVSTFVGARADLARIAASYDSEPLGTFMAEAARVGERRRATAALRDRREVAPGTAREGVAEGARAPMSEVLGLDALGTPRLFGLTFIVPGGGG